MSTEPENRHHARHRSIAHSATAPSRHSYPDPPALGHHLKLFFELTETCLAELFYNSQSKMWSAICMTASLQPIHPDWQRSAKVLAVIGRSKGAEPCLQALIEWKLQFQFLIDQQYGPDSPLASAALNGQATRKSVRAKGEPHLSVVASALTPLQRESRQRQNIALEIAFFRVIYIFLLEWTRKDEAVLVSSAMFERLHHLVLKCLLESEWTYALAPVKAPVAPASLSSMLYGPVYYLVGRVISLLGSIDFRTVTEGVLASISELLQQPQPSLIELPRLLGLVESLRFLELKVYPLEQLEQVSCLLHTCGRLSEASASTMLHATTKNAAVFVRLAWSRLFHFWLLPMVSSLTAELNVPSFMKSICFLYDSCSSLVRKSPRQYPALAPLVALLLCTSRRDAFVSKWTGFVDFVVCRLLKDKTHARMGFACLSRLVWTYLYRVSESYAEIATHLAPILRALYNASTGPHGSATAGPGTFSSSSAASSSDLSRYSKPYAPAGLPVYHHVRFLSVIGAKSLELVCHAVLLEGIGVSSLLSTHSFSRQIEWTHRLYQYFLQWWSHAATSQSLAAASSPVSTIQKEILCAEKGLVCLHSFLHILVEYVLHGKSPPPFPIESCYGEGGDDHADPEYSYYHFDAIEGMVPSSAGLLSSSYTFQCLSWTQVTSAFSRPSLDRYCTYFEAAAYGRQEIFDKFARATLVYLEMSESVLVRLLEVVTLCGAAADPILGLAGSFYAGLPGSAYASMRRRPALASSERTEPFLAQDKTRCSAACPDSSESASPEWLDDTSDASSSSDTAKLAAACSSLVEWLIVLVRYVPWVCVHYSNALPSTPHYRPMMIGPKSSMVPVAQSSPLLRLSAASRRACLWSLVLAACYPAGCPLRLAGQEGLGALLSCSSAALDWRILVLRVLEAALEASVYYHASKSIALLSVYMYTLEAGVRGPLSSAVLEEMVLARALLCLCSPALEIRQAGVLLLEKSKEHGIAGPFMQGLLYLLEESLPGVGHAVSLRCSALQLEHVFLWQRTGYGYLIHRVGRCLSASRVGEQVAERMMHRLSLVPSLLGGVSLVAMGLGTARDGDASGTKAEAPPLSWHAESKLKPADVLSVVENDVLWLTEGWPAFSSSLACFHDDLTKLLLSLLQFQYSAFSAPQWTNSLQPHAVASGSSHPHPSSVSFGSWIEWSMPLAAGSVPMLQEPRRSRLLGQISKWAALNKLAGAVLKCYVDMYHDLAVFLEPPPQDASVLSTGPHSSNGLFINGTRSGPYWTTILLDWLCLLSSLSCASPERLPGAAADGAHAAAYELWTIQRTSRALEYYQAQHAFVAAASTGTLEWEWVLMIGGLGRLLCHRVLCEDDRARTCLSLPLRLWRVLLYQLLAYSYFGPYEANSRARESRAMSAMLKESPLLKSRLSPDVLQLARDDAECCITKALLPMVRLGVSHASACELEPPPNLSALSKRDATTRKSLVLSPLRKSTQGSMAHAHSYSNIMPISRSAHVSEGVLSPPTTTIPTGAAYFAWMKEEWRAIVPALLFEHEERAGIIQIYACLLETDKVTSAYEGGSSFYHHTIETLWRLGFDLRFEAYASPTRVGLGQCIARLLKSIALFLASSASMNPLSVKASLYPSDRDLAPPPPLSLALIESTRVFCECLARLASLVYYLDWICGAEPLFERGCLAILDLLHSGPDTEHKGWVHRWTLALDVSLAQGAGSRLFVEYLLKEEARRHLTWPPNLLFDSVFSCRRRSGHGFFCSASWHTWILAWDRPGRVLDHMISVRPCGSNVEPIEESILAFWLKRNTKACVEWICGHLAIHAEPGGPLEQQWTVVRLFSSALGALTRCELVDVSLSLYRLREKDEAGFVFALCLLGFLTAEPFFSSKHGAFCMESSDAGLERSFALLLTHLTFVCLEMIEKERHDQGFPLAMLFLARGQESLKTKSKVTALLAGHSRASESVSHSHGMANLSFFVNTIAKRDASLLYSLLSCALESQAWSLLRLFLRFVDLKLWAALQPLVASFVLPGQQPEPEGTEKQQKEEFILAYLQLLCSAADKQEPRNNWRLVVAALLKRDQDARFAFQMASKLLPATAALTIECDALMQGLWAPRDVELGRSALEFLMASLGMRARSERRDALTIPIAYLYYYFGPEATGLTSRRLKGRLLEEICADLTSLPSSFSDVISFLKRGGQELKVIALFYTRFPMEALEHDMLLCNLYRLASQAMMDRVCEFMIHALVAGKVKSRFPKLAAELGHQMVMRSESQLELLRTCHRLGMMSRPFDEAPTPLELEPQELSESVCDYSRDALLPTTEAIMAASVEELKVTLGLWRDYYQRLSCS